MKRLDVNNKGMATLLNVSPTTVGNWLDGKYKPEAVLITKLADLARLPWRQVFDIVYPQTDGPIGVLPGDDPETYLDPMALEILQMMANRPDAEQAAILATVKALVENFDRGSGKREQTGGAGKSVKG